LRKENRKGGKMRENCIEWIEGDSRVTITTYSKKFINKIKAISEESPEDVEIIKENEDGSICAHASINCIGISPKRKYNISDERRQELRERFEKIRRHGCGETS
jgi:hypothetical protein